MTEIINGSLLHLLHRASQKANAHFAEAAERNITPRQYAILSATAALECTSQTQLVEVTGIDRSTMADVVRRMVQNGLLSRSRDAQDRRTNNVEITFAGREMLNISMNATRTAEAVLLSKLTSEERREFGRILNLIIATDTPGREFY